MDLENEMYIKYFFLNLQQKIYLLKANFKTSHIHRKKIKKKPSKISCQCIIWNNIWIYVTLVMQRWKLVWKSAN